MRKFISSQFGSLLIAMIIVFSYVVATLVYLWRAVRGTTRLIRRPVYITGCDMSRWSTAVAAGSYGFFAFSIPDIVIGIAFDFHSVIGIGLSMALLSWCIQGHLPGMRKVVVGQNIIEEYDSEGLQWYRYENLGNLRYAFWPIRTLMRQMSMFVCLAVVTIALYLLEGGSWPRSRTAAVDALQTQLVPVMYDAVWLILPFAVIWVILRWIIKMLVEEVRVTLSVSKAFS